MSWTLSLTSDPAQTVTMPDPATLVNTSSQVIDHYLFGDGSYAVQDAGDGGESIMMTGILQSDDTLGEVEGIIGESVTISGLSDSNLDGEYLMEDFTVNYLSGPGYPEWTLTIRKL